MAPTTKKKKPAQRPGTEPHASSTGKVKGKGKGPGKAPPHAKTEGKSAKPAKKLPAANQLRIGVPLLLGLFGLALAAYGFAITDQALQVAVARGRDAVAEPAGTLAGIMLGAGVGLILAWLLATRMKAITGIITAAIIIGAATAGGSLGTLSLIDQLVENTSPAQRQAAFRSQFLPQSVAASAFQTNGLPSNPTDMDTHAFVAGIGALGAVDPTVYDRIESNLDQLATAILARSLNEAEAWRKFQEAVAETQRDYERYSTAANAYQQTRASLNQRSDQLWTAVVQSATARWNNYLQRREQAVQQLNARIPDFRDLLSVYFQVHQRGRSTVEIDRRYEEFSTELFGKYVDPQIWCGRSGCPGTEEFIANTGITVLSNAFLERFGNLPLNLTEAQFVAHPSVITTIRQEVATEGVNLPENWTLSAEGRDMLLTAAIRDLPVEAEKRYNASINEWFGVSLAPDLDYPDFIAQEGIQKRLRASLRLPGELRIDPAIDEATFATDYYPRIERRPVDALAGDMQAPLEDFENGGRLADGAKTSLKLLFALPLVMFTAGFAGLSGTIIGSCLLLLSFWHMVAKLLKLGAPTVLKINKVFRLSSGILLILALASPVLLGKGVARYPGYGSALQPAVMTSPVIGIPSDWAMRTVTDMQETGASLRSLAFNQNDFGLKPVIAEREDGFGFVFDSDANDPNLLNEEPKGPVGITGIKQRLDSMIDRATNRNEAN